MRYRGDTVAAAARRVLDRIVALGGDGGLIAIDRTGRIAMPFVSEGMYRGTLRAGRYMTAIYR
jgi:beta-aspartyl-peptidase (threonine type)